jgi:hypothetical protein
MRASSHVPAKHETDMPSFAIDQSRISISFSPPRKAVSTSIYWKPWAICMLQILTSTHLQEAIVMGNLHSPTTPTGESKRLTALDDGAHGPESIGAFTGDTAQVAPSEGMLRLPW